MLPHGSLDDLLLLLLLLFVCGRFICLLLLRILSSLLCGDVDDRIVALRLWSLAREWIGRRATESSGIARKKEQRENGGYGTLFSVVYHRRRTVGEIQLGTASCVPLVHAPSHNDTSGGGQATGARRRLAARLDLSQG